MLEKKKAEGTESEVQVYERQVHGLALRGERGVLESESEREAMDRAE